VTGLVHVARVCGSCGATALPVKVTPEVWAEPEGWTTVQISGRPAVTSQLCGACTHVVRTAITQTRRPAVPA